MSKWIPLIVLALLAGVGAYLLTLSNPRETGGINSGLEAEPETQRQETPADLNKGPEVRPTQEPDKVPVLIPAQVERGILGPKIKAAIAAGDFVVMALDPRSKKPIEGMSVWLLDRDQLALGEWQQLGSDPDALRQAMQTRGAESVTNSEGGASFAGVLNGALLAEGNGWTASADWIGPIESPYVLKLLPRKELIVRVVDKEGKAQREVPVWIGPVENDRWVPMIQRTTPASGEIGFDRVARLGGRADKSNIGVFLGFPHSPKAAISIDPNNLPTDVVELPMVPARPLIIRVVDENGEPRTDNVQVEIGLEPGRDATFQSVLTRRLRNGQTEFPLIGLGTRLQVRLSGIAELQTKVVNIGSISSGGDTPEHTIEWHEKRAVFVGLARNAESGGLLIETTLRATWSDGKETRSSPLRTDANGEFRLVTQGPEARSLKIEAPQTADRPKLLANPSVPNPPPAGEYSLGTVNFDGEPLFASGRIVDSTGVPIPGAHVRVEVKQEGKPGGDKARKGGRGLGTRTTGVNLPDEKPGKGRGEQNREELQTHWAPIPGLSGSTNADGEFQIYGRGHGRNMRLVVQRRGFGPLRREHIRAGAAPYELVMSGSLAQVTARENGNTELIDKLESGEGEGD